MSPGSPALHGALIGVLVTVMMIHLLWLGRQRPPAGQRQVPADREAAKAHLLWGLFYVNPRDPRGWVPKIYGFGWTVNFRARTHVWVFLALLLATFLEAGLLTWAAFALR